MVRKILSALLGFILPSPSFWKLPFSFTQNNKIYTIAVFDLDSKGISAAEEKLLSDFLQGKFAELISSELYLKQPLSV